MRRPTAASASAWTKSSTSARRFAEVKLAELRPARSPITAPTGRFFRFLAALPSIPGHLVVAALVLGGIGCLLIARFGLPL